MLLITEVQALNKQELGERVQPTQRVRTLNQKEMGVEAGREGLW